LLREAIYIRQASTWTGIDALPSRLFLVAIEQGADFTDGRRRRISKNWGDSDGRGLNANCVMRTRDLRAKLGPGGAKTSWGQANKRLRGLGIYICWFEEYDIQPVKQA